LAAFVAGMRLKNVIDKNLSETNGSKREGALQRHITGAQGELAFAKHFNKYWAPIDAATMFHGDVGPIEVRSVEFEPPKPDKPNQLQRRLYVLKDDKNERRFVHAIVKLPFVQLRGWMLGLDAKRASWWEEPQAGRPVYLVPHENLMPIENFEWT
jgi:hypothetical protein